MLLLRKYVGKIKDQSIAKAKTPEERKKRREAEIVHTRVSYPMALYGDSVKNPLVQYFDLAIVPCMIDAGPTPSEQLRMAR